MGIRYYAYPVEPELVDKARADPETFISADPLMDAWGPTHERPTMLYLDKCWSPLQRLTHPDPMADPRPAFRLFEGEVTPTHGGLAWYAWFRVLGPDEVASIADDLVDIGDQEVEALVASYADPNPDDYPYIRHHLTAAQEFTMQMAREGKAIIYMIG